MSEWYSNERILDLINNLSIDNIEAPFVCPLCKKNDGHLFIFGNKDEIGKGFAWCSSCSNYSSFNLHVPSWWENYKAVSTYDLGSFNDYLEKNKKELDEHLNNLLKNK